MSVANILLALSNSVRPTVLAALAALLTSKRPKRFVLAYVLAGFVVSMVIGVLVVTLLHHATNKHHNQKWHGWIELGLGVIVLTGTAYVVIRERRHPKQNRESGNGNGRVVKGRIAKLLDNPSSVGSGLLGIATHAPGAAYIAALDAIIETKPSFVNGFIQVFVHNLIWFAIPIAALILAMVDLEDAQAKLNSGLSWTRRHWRVIGPSLLAVVGVYLGAKGLSKVL